MESEDSIPDRGSHLPLPRNIDGHGENLDGDVNAPLKPTENVTVEDNEVSLSFADYDTTMSRDVYDGMLDVSGGYRKPGRTRGSCLIRDVPR